MISRTIPRMFVVVAGALILVYFGLIACLWSFQEWMLFHPYTMTEQEWQSTAEEVRGDYITVRVSYDEHLQGWFLHDYTEQPRPTIIFFGGNAEQMQDTLRMVAPLRDRGFNLLVTDYRGYGLSEGSPSVENMKNDALILFDAVLENPLVDTDHIILWGNSIGAGVAMHVASQRPVDRLILFSPFTSIADVSQWIFPIAPRIVFQALLRHHLAPIELASQIGSPALIISGALDDQIPKDHPRLVADAWGGDVVRIEVPDRGHNDLLASEMAWQGIYNFLGASVE